MEDVIQYWFCTKHHRVEWEKPCRAMHRLGPYASRSEAEHALDKFADRAEQWQSDPRWNDEPEDDEPENDESDDAKA